MSMLAFYKEHAISPVRQDVTDRSAHFARRSSLYRSLGLPPVAVRGKTVLEVGPGSGDNALYTASLEPARYVFVEPNPTGAQAIRARWPLTRAGGNRYDVVETPIEAYASDQPFDVVLCEGVLGLCGTNASALLEAVARHVAPGGVLVITCIDPISDHAEIVRRAYAQQVIDRSASLAQQLEVVRPIFAPHLATLTGMTRSVDDWILDNLLNPASVGQTFSIPEALAQLEGRFDVLGMSPRFLTDWRWYKQAGPGNAWAIEAYWRQAHNLLDYRVVEPPRSAATNRALMAECLAYRTQLRAFEAGIGTLPDPTLGDIGWFGRGQQYLSFVRQ